MRKKWWLFLVVPPALALFGWIFGEVVMHLWNWLLPMLFGWRTITFWQALGLALLCRILFGSWGSGGHDRRGSRRAWRERWDRMTPEEREKFRQGTRGPCGGFGAPPGQTGEPA
jgi:hypothetical protein